MSKLRPWMLIWGGLVLLLVFPAVGARELFRAVAGDDGQRPGLFLPLFVAASPAAGLALLIVGLVRAVRERKARASRDGS